MWLLAAPRSAFLPAACVSLARRRLCRNFEVSTSAGADRRQARIRPVTDLRWRLAGGPGRSRRMVPSGLTLAGRWKSGISAARSTPPSFRRGAFSSSRAPVCVPPRHARVSGGDGEPVRTGSPSASRGGRPLQRPGLFTCDSRRPRRRSRLAGLRMVRCIRRRNGS